MGLHCSDQLQLMPCKAWHAVCGLHGKNGLRLDQMHLKAQPTMNPKLKSEDQSVSEQITDAINGTDEPMEIAHPGSTPLLVMGMYPLILVIAIAIALGYFTLFRAKQSDTPGAATTTADQDK